MAEEKIVQKEQLSGEKMKLAAETYLSMLKKIHEKEQECEISRFDLNHYDGREAFRKKQKELTALMESEEFKKVKFTFRKCLDGMKRFLIQKTYWKTHVSIMKYQGTESVDVAMTQTKEILKEIKIFNQKYKIENIFV